MIDKKAARFGLVLVGCSLGAAQDVLPPLTVLAKKFDSEKKETTSALDILSADELERMQRDRLLDGLNFFPGVQGLSTAGQTGNLGTVMMRGLSTKYMQVVVDGVRLTGATNGSNSFLGIGQLDNITQLEVLRGPQSVLYGSGAAGGVVGYETLLGTDDEGTLLSAEAGNFGTFRSSFTNRGQIGDLSYAVNAGVFETENDPSGAVLRHDFNQAFGSLALQWQAREDLLLRLSYRGSQNELETLSDFGFGASPAKIDTDVNLIALNAEYEVNPWWSSKLTLGYYDESYHGDFNGFQVMTDYGRYTANWANSIEVSDSLELVSGLEYARGDYRNLNGREVDFRTLGAYVNGFWKPIDGLLLEAGLRYEDHDSFDNDVAWNLGAAYEIEGAGTRLRARLAEAYRTPTLLESEAFVPGFGAIQLANPNLKPEDILGFEVGIEQDFSGHLAELSYFQQHLENAIVRGPTTAGSYANINRSGTSKVSGLELALSGQLSTESVRYRLSATKQFQEEVLDVSDLLLSADLGYDSDRWSVGAGFAYQEGATYGFNPTGDHFVARVYGEIQLNEAITLFGRVENLFDEDYLLSDDGFSPVKGLGRSFVIGARVEW
jgi:vitamin B12 transporter